MRCVWLSLMICLSAVQGSNWVDGKDGKSMDSFPSEQGTPVRVASPGSTQLGVDAHEVSATGASTVVSSKAQEEIPPSNQIPLCLSLYTATHGVLTFAQDTEKTLRAAAALVRSGDTVRFIFEPSIQLRDPEGGVISVSGKQHYFDMIPWTAWLRAGVKWWLNPWAWWDPARYSLCRGQCEVSLPEGVLSIKVSVPKVDWGYVGNQVAQYLLQTEWTTTWFYPNVSGYTAYMAEFALKRRFKEVEKPALESARFTDIELIRGVHPETQQLRWMIRATKR